MYESSDTGEVVSEHVARPGAIWLAPRLAGVMDSKFHIDRGGGPHILIKLPGNHVWDASGKSTNGEGWEVSGDLTCLTASPSILVGGRVPYHGWLRNGVLVEC